MTEAAIQWHQASFAVRHGFWMKSKPLLHDIDISIPGGSVLGLVGANGAGKTTTIKLGAGLLKPQSGSVTIHGRPAAEPSARKKIGLLTENQYIYPHLKLKEWLIMLAGFSGLTGRERTRKAEEALEQVELKDRADQMMRTFSKGQLQRAGIAQVFVHEPKILLLDEPMSGLDPYWRHRIQEILSNFKASGGTILFSSHILMDVERLSDQLVFLQSGRIKWSGRLSDLPREITGYEVICHAEQTAALKKITDDKPIDRLPKGECRFTISPSQKSRLLSMAASDAIQIVSLRPIQQELEEIFFDLSSKKENSSA